MTEQLAPQKKTRAYSFDFLKLIASIIIVFLHYQQHYKADYPGINFYGGSFDFGIIVELFFILSGFFIVSYEAKVKDGLSFGTFYTKRLARLLPLLVISAVAYCTAYTLRMHLTDGSWITERVSIWNLLVTCLGIQDGWVVENPGINNPTWYISVLLLCYGVFYIVNFFARRWQIENTSWLYALIILIGIGIKTYKVNTLFLTTHSARGYYAFFWGCILAKYMKGRAFPKKTIAAALLVSLLGLAIVVSGRSSALLGETRYAMTFVFLPPIILLFNTDSMKKLFNSPAWGIAGRVSFDAYIWHACVFQVIDIIRLLHLIDSESMRTVPAMLIVTALSFAIAYLSYVGIEKPIEKRLSAL